ncbi:MAG TPA: helix-turn-helix transcriptional regulator [Gammaproteobacteria bacterium]|nr:helix-turn-helix transcriptional regulator [Gammaproteobacteria bacterium]
MENLSTILSHLMSEKGIKSAELARKTGIGQPVVYRLMTGVTENPQVLTLKPIADFFGVSLDQLLGLSPLNNQRPMDNTLLHHLNNKLTTIKTIASALVDLLPDIIEGYQKAVSVNLIKETVPSDILPLLQLNITNLLKATNQIQELLITYHYMKESQL